MSLPAGNLDNLLFVGFQATGSHEAAVLEYNDTVNLLGSAGLSLFCMKHLVIFLLCDYK